MKKFRSIIIGLIFIITACTKTPQSSKQQRTVIAPFHITHMLMRPADSTEVRTNISLPYDQVFLNKQQFALFEKNVWAMFHDSISTIYDDLGREPIDKKKFLEIRKGWDLRHITLVDCYQTWYFNPENKMIERETLGYSIFEYFAEKQAYRMLGCVFKDDEARKKAIDNYFSSY